MFVHQITGKNPGCHSQTGTWITSSKVCSLTLTYPIPNSPLHRGPWAVCSTEIPPNTLIPTHSPCPSFSVVQVLMSGSCLLDLAILEGGGPVSQEAESNRGSWGCIGQGGWQLETGFQEGEPQDTVVGKPLL